MSYYLPSLIRSIPDFSEKTPADCREYFAEETTTQNTHRWTFQELLDLPQFNNSEINELLKVAAEPFPLLEVMLLTGGVDLSVTRNRESLLVVRTVVPALATVIDRVLSLGQDTRTRWAREGITDDLPDLAEFETAHAEAMTPIQYDHRTTQLSVVLQPNGKAILSCRIVACDAAGRTGDTLATVASADADSVELPLAIASILSSLRSYVESV